MAHQELGGYVLLVGYGLMLLGAIRVFGIRRVLLVMFALVVFGFSLAFRTLAGISSRRY